MGADPRCRMVVELLQPANRSPRAVTIPGDASQREIDQRHISALVDQDVTAMQIGNRNAPCVNRVDQLLEPIEGYSWDRSRRELVQRLAAGPFEYQTVWPLHSQALRNPR